LEQIWLRLGNQLKMTVDVPQTERFVVSHNLSIVMVVWFKLFSIHKQGNVARLERGEHARDVGNLNVLSAKRDLGVAAEEEKTHFSRHLTLTKWRCCYVAN
jgi:hypothetical protein